VHANSVADLEFGDVGLELFLLYSVDDPVHNGSSRGGWRGDHFQSGEAKMQTGFVRLRQQPVAAGCALTAGRYNSPPLRP
jgi:hypothetical protein